MFTTAAQRVARARERFAISPTAPVVMTSPSGGFNQALPGETVAPPLARDRLVRELGLDPAGAVFAWAGALGVDGEQVWMIPLTPANTDFADPVVVPRSQVQLRWWDVGRGASVTCRLWLTLADGRWLLVDVPRKALFMRSKFAVGLDDLLTALQGRRIDPATGAA